MLGRAILVAALAGATAAAVQDRQTFRSGVDLVQVDVSVLDKDRQPVRGLTAADFTILEDGKPRPIVAFVPVELAEREVLAGRACGCATSRRTSSTTTCRPEGRLVVIMFDWSIRFEDQQLARRIATAAVDPLGPDDLAAVVFTSACANGGAPQNFTADRARLLAAINRPLAVALLNPPVGPTHDPAQRERSDDRRPGGLRKRRVHLPDVRGGGDRARRRRRARRARPAQDAALHRHVLPPLRRSPGPASAARPAARRASPAWFR